MKNDYVLNHVSVNESRLMYIFFKKFNITHNVEETGIGLGIVNTWFSRCVGL